MVCFGTVKNVKLLPNETFPFTVHIYFIKKVILKKLVPNSEVMENVCVHYYTTHLHLQG